MSLSDLKLKNHSLNKQIYDALKNQIINDQINPGERLVIDKIANEIGVSSTPVRDALQLLISSGYAKKTNNGIFVIELSKDDVIELFDMREVLEGLAVRLLTKKIKSEEVNLDGFKILEKTFKEKEKELLEKSNHISHELDVNFHDLVLKLTEKKRLKKQIKLIINQTYRIRNIQHRSKSNIALDEEKIERMLRETQEHISIIEKMIKGNCEEAENMMRKHIRNSKKDILTQVF